MNKKNLWKKILAIILVMGLLFTLAGDIRFRFGNDKKEEASVSDSPDSAEPESTEDTKTNKPTAAEYASMTQFQLEGKVKEEEHREKTIEEQQETLIQDEGLYAADSIVLENTTKADAERIAKELGATFRLSPQEDYAVLYLPEGLSIDQVYANADWAVDVTKMSPDYYVSSNELTYDIPDMPDETGEDEDDQLQAPRLKVMKTRPFYTPNDTDFDAQDYMDYIGLKDTWNETKGAGITVAVIDSGIDTDHPEFEGKISEWSYNASEDEIVKDYDISVIEDENGHGTKVAGVLCAAMDNEKGISGIAPDINLLVIKCKSIDECGHFLGSDAVLGLAYAIEQDVDIVNMSFGGGEDIFSRYTELAVDSDIICIASAGNDGSSIPQYPAALDTVIAVGAYDTENDTIADYSNYGENVDILAPGTVYTTSIGGYNIGSGTSFSSPIASAAAALYMSKNGKVGFSKMLELFRASSIDVGILGEDFLHGFGELDIHALVCEEKGTITYEMLSDELANQTQLFVRGRTVQSMPEPERTYVVYDGWYFDPNCYDECDLYTNVFNEDITLYASWVNEDDGWAYTYTTKDDNTIEVCSYTGKRRYASVPVSIEGKLVTSVGEQCFADNTRLRSVELPDTITEIGGWAFSGCSSLRRIEIPDAVTEIGIEAFANCSRLSEISIGIDSNLTTIKSKAFAFCGISSFFIPSGVNSIGDYLFYGSTGLKSLSVADGNTSFRIKNGALYTYAGDTLVYYPSANLTEYVIDADTVIIGKGAFAYSRSGSILMQEGIESIEEKAFEMSRITIAEIPGSVNEMGIYVFSNCSRLSSVSFSGDCELAVIPKGTFYKTSGLKTITIPASITVIDKYAFQYSGIVSIDFPTNSKLSKIGINAFRSSSIKTISIPKSTISISQYAFCSCHQLSEVIFGSHSKLFEIQDYAFAHNSSLITLTIPDSVCKIGNNAFYKSCLTEITIGTGTGVIGKGAFANCRKLTQINVDAGNTDYISYDGILYNKDKTVLLQCPAGRSGECILPDTVQRIEDYAFSGAANISSVALNEGLKEIGQFAFEDCVALETPDFPSTLTNIGSYAFGDCYSLSGTIILPRKLCNIESFVFYNDYNLTGIDFEPESEISRLGYGSFGYCGIEDFTIPRNVSSMGQEVFVGCKDLLTVTFESESKLTYIPAWCFNGANNLRRITFEADSSLSHIEARACEKLFRLEMVDLTGCDDLIDIDNYAFNKCPSLSDFDIPSSVENIGRYAFYGCSSLGELRIPANVTHVGSFAFDSSNNITLYFVSAILPDRLDENWDAGVGAYYVGVEKTQENEDWVYAVTPDGKASVIKYKGTSETIDLTTIDGYEVVSIGGEAFINNTNLKSIILPDTLTGIYSAAFKGTVSLESIAIPANVKTIESEAFAGSGLQSIVFDTGSKLSSLGTSVFENTDNLESVILPDGLTKLRESTFKNSGIKTIVLPNNLQEIGRLSFADSKLTQIAIPASVKEISYKAFQNASNLSDITFADAGLKENLGASNSADKLMIRDEAFYNTGLLSIVIPSYVNYLGNLVFSSCNKLVNISVDEDNSYYASLDGVLYDKSLTKLINCPSGKTGSLSINENVQMFSFGAFEGSQLSELVIPENSSLATIGHRTFADCRNLTTINIPDSVLSIESYAFARCDNLETVLIHTTSRLQGIYEGAFYDCTRLNSIVIPDGVLEISEYAFYGCVSLKDVSIGEDSKLQEIYDHAFEHAGIELLKMPVNLFEIGSYAFSDSGLKRIVFNNEIERIGEYAFANIKLDEQAEIIIPDSIRAAGKSIFAGDNIDKLVIQSIGGLNDCLSCLGYVIDATVNNLTILRGVIDSETFLVRELNYMDVKNIYLSDGMIVNKNSFSFIPEVKTIRLPEGLTVIEDGLFSWRQSLEYVYLPDSLEEIGKGSFEHCSRLKEIIVPSTCRYIAENAFVGCKNLSIKIDDDNKWYVEKSGVVYSSDFKKIVFFSDKTMELVLPEQMKSIPEFFFSEKKIRKVVIPEGVKEIPYMAFACCYDLETVELPSSLERIDDDAFLVCCSLKNITIPASCNYIGKSAFSDCRSLENITIPASCNYIGEGAFSSCSALCIHVEKENEYYIEKAGVIYNSDYSKILHISADVTDFIVPSQFENIPEGWLKGGTNIQTLVIPEGVKKIGNRAFCNLPSLETVVLPNSLENIGDYFLTGCNELKTVYIDDDNPRFCLKNGVLYDKNQNRVITSLGTFEKFTIQEGTFEIAPGAFSGKEKIKEINLPDSLEIIGKYAFFNCINLSDIHIGKNVKRIGDSAFSNTRYLRDYIYIKNCYEDNIVYLDNYAIEVMSKTESEDYYFKDGTTLLCDNILLGSVCRKVYIPDSVLYIGEGYIRTKYLHMGSNVKSDLSEVFGGEVLELHGHLSSLESVYLSTSKYLCVDDCTIDDFEINSEGEIQTYSGPIFGYHPANCIINTIDQLNASIINEYSPSTFYFNFTKEQVETNPNIITDGNQCYYSGEWAIAKFYVDGFLIEPKPQLVNTFLQTPASSEVNELLPDGATFYGWDINKDGIVDQLPTVLNDNIIAEAVYDCGINSVVLDYDEIDQDNTIPKVKIGKYTIEEGESLRLSYRLFPSQYNRPDTIIWSSSDDSCLQIEDDGKVKAVGIPENGYVTVRASLLNNPEVYDEVRVYITPKSYGISLEEESAEVNVGSTYKISASAIVQEEQTDNITYRSNDESIATVDENGLVSAIAPGYAEIILECGEYTNTFVVNVKQPITNLKLDSESGEINVGDDITIIPVIEPSNTTDDKTIVWYSKDPSIAKVKNGVVSGVAPGTVEIVATNGKLKAVYTVTVKAPIEKIILNTTKGTLRLDHTKQLDVIYIPDNTTDDKNVTWNSENPSIASVDENGLVTGQKTGKTVITGTVNAGTENEHSATYTVSVIGIRDPDTGITVTNSDDTEMEEGTELSVDDLEPSELTGEMSKGWLLYREALYGWLHPGFIRRSYIYDISMLFEGQTVQPGTTVDVELPIPLYMSHDRIIVYRIEEDGTITDMHGYIQNGKYCFKTDHFSVYAFGTETEESYIEEISPEEDKISLCAGTTGEINYKTVPETPDHNAVTFVSDNESVVTVDESGKLKAIAPGNANISISTEIEAVSTEVAVTVTSHSWNEGVRHEPTCTENGDITKTCLICGEEDVEILQAPGHNMTHQEAKEAEPTEDGNVEYWYCENCKKYYSDEAGTAELAEEEVTIQFADIWPFTDMKIRPGNWAFEGIRFAVKHRLISGDSSDTGKTTVRPKDDISRREFIVILYRMAGQPALTDDTSPFPDMKLKADGSKPFYYDAAVWAYQSGIVTGKSGNMLAGKDPITRQEIAVMMMRYADHAKLSTADKANISGYSDYSAVSSWAKDALAWANAKGLITGREKNGVLSLSPKEHAQRQECATILQRFYNAFGLE